MSTNNLTGSLSADVPLVVNLPTPTPAAVEVVVINDVGTDQWGYGINGAEIRAWQPRYKRAEIRDRSGITSVTLKSTGDATYFVRVSEIPARA